MDVRPRRRLRASATSRGYPDPVAKEVVRSWTVTEFFADVRPPTDDEFPVALDGRLLDTPAKVIAYIDEINANRSAAQHGG